MEYWEPDPIWQGEDVYIIGGGPSLKKFEHWDVLLEKNTIGCNTAYVLGSNICNFVFFLDKSFWDKNKEQLAKYQGPVVSNLSNFAIHKPPKWVKVMRRIPRGLGTGDTIASNFSSGACAVNLAITLGAANVYLLGIDVKSIDGDVNWHDESTNKPSKRGYLKFIEGFQLLADAVREQKLHVKIINVNNDSNLRVFPTECVEDHFKDLTLDLGNDVTEDFENTKEASVQVYRKGRWHTIYDAQDTTYTPLNEKSLSKQQAQQFIDEQKEKYVENAEI